MHLCIDKATGHKKAVKIMPKARAKQAPERTQRKLEREVALMTRISRESRAVAQLVDVFEDRSYVYIVMDLLEGGDLEQLLEVSFPVSCLSMRHALPALIGHHCSLQAPAPASYQLDGDC